MGAPAADQGRACAQCGKPLSRYNQENLCQACIRSGSGPRQRAGIHGPLVNGAKLAQLRRERGWTQETLAGQAGLSTVLVRKLEQEARQSARISTLSALAQALAIPVDVLLRDPSGSAQDETQESQEHRVREAEQARPTLLRSLILQRHWQRFQTFEAQFRRAAKELAGQERDPGLAKLTVSPRQWERWYAGKVKTEPHPDACRVLEHMFGYPVRQLFTLAPEVRTANQRAHASAVHAPDVRSLMRPEQGHRIIQALEVMSHDDLTGIAGSLAELIDHYSQTICALPPAEVYDELIAVRSYSSRVIERGGFAPQRKDINLAVGWLSALLAVAACDIGEHAAARIWCSDAERRSHETGYPELAGWAILTKAMIAFYQGKPHKSATLAAHGQAITAASTVVHAKLASHEMRAAAMIGDTERMLRARSRAAKSIADLPAGTRQVGAFSITITDDPPYTATSLLFAGRFSEAVEATGRVIQNAYHSEQHQRGEHPSGYARSLLILGLANAGLGNLEDAAAAGHAALDGSRPAWPTMVLAGKLDQVLTRDYPRTRQAADYHARYLGSASHPAGHHLQSPAPSEDF